PLSRRARAPELPRRRRLPRARRPLCDAGGRRVGQERPASARERLRPASGGPLPVDVRLEARVPRRRAGPSTGVPLRVLSLPPLREGVGTRERVETVGGRERG